MNAPKRTSNDNLFPVRKRTRNPASLTQDEIAGIMQWAEAHDLSEEAKFKLLLAFRGRKKAAYAKKKTK
jgi:hypothetical protein